MERPTVCSTSRHKDLNIGGKTDVYPSWFDQKAGNSDEKLTLIKYPKRKLQIVRQQMAKIEIECHEINWILLLKPTYIAPDGYDASKDDDIHK